MLYFLFGLIIGSFLNVLIYRLPKGESIAFPPSHCPTCNHRLSPWELIPVISFFLQRGKCKNCQASISIRYPLVELLCGFLLYFTYLKFGLTLSFARVAMLMILLIPIFFIDLDTMTIPDQLSLGGAGVAFLLAMFDHKLLLSLYGAITGAGIIYGIYLLGLMIYKQETIGGGDVKLMLMIGAFLGIKLTLMTLMLAMISGSVIGVLLIILKIKSRKDFIPFGPFIALGCVMAVFFAQQIGVIYSAVIIR